MPIDRDDNEERLARLEKLLEEARPKASADVSDATPPADAVDTPKASPQAKATLRKPASKRARQSGKND